jgi:hypothetical protein
MVVKEPVGVVACIVPWNYPLLLGREGLEAFQETKHVHMDTVIEAKEWWYPYAR